MDPIYPGNLSEHIYKVVVTFLDSGKVQQLTTRPGSSNHFFDRFEVGADEVQLRLDWSDMDVNGQPSLDANFTDRETGRPRALKGRRRKAHHTRAISGDDRTYEWEFDGASLRFAVAVTWRATASDTLHATDSSDATIVRAADQNKIG